VTRALIGVLCCVALAAVLSAAAGDTNDPAFVVCRELRSSPSDGELLEMLRIVAERHTNAGDRARYLTIYALGCYAAGAADKGDLVKKYLTIRHLEDPWVLQLAGRGTKAPCSQCNGLGEFVSPCPDCQDGTCLVCKGSGRVMGTGLLGRRVQLCGTCRGTGKCRICGGTRVLRKACPACGGRGLRTSPDAARNAFVRALDQILAGRTDSPGFAGLAETIADPVLEPVAVETTAAVDESPARTERPGREQIETPTPPPQRPPRPVKSMDDFVAAVRNLRDAYRSGQAQPVGLKDVQLNPVRYLGSVLRVRGYMAGFHPRAIPVVERPGAAAGYGLVLTPDSMAVSDRTSLLYDSEGSETPMEFTIGPLSASRVILFEARPVRAPEP
jgi:hypothetical protein